MIGWTEQRERMLAQKWLAGVNIRYIRAAFQWEFTAADIKAKVAELGLEPREKIRPVEGHEKMNEWGQVFVYGDHGWMPLRWADVMKGRRFNEIRYPKKATA